MNRMSHSHPSAPTRAEQLADTLNREEQGKTTLAREIERYADDDETLAADLGLIAALRAVELPASDAADARARVERRLRAFLASEVAASDTVAPSVAPPHRPPSMLTSITLTIPARPSAGRDALLSSGSTSGSIASAQNAVTIALKAPSQRQSQPTRRASGARVVALVAALLLIVVGAVLAVSNAAAVALPESPLYQIKLANEEMALQFAWTDTQRGQALAQIADHRLTEARAEAHIHQSEAQSLTLESDAAMSQLITLLEQMRAQHEDTGVVAQALSDELQAEQTAYLQAQRQGLSGFAQTLALTLHNQQGAIATGHLPVSVPPALPATPTGTVSGATTPTSQQHGQPNGTPGASDSGSDGKPTGTPGAGSHPTPTPHGKHTDHGGGGGNGHSHGH